MAVERGLILVPGYSSRLHFVRLGNCCCATCGCVSRGGAAAAAVGLDI